MTEAFGTVPFTILADGMARAQDAEISVTHIPGGAVTYVDYGGALPLQLDYRLLLSEANFRVLETKVGGTAQLVSEVDGTISSALLLNLQRTNRIPASGTTYAGAAFLVMAA